MRDHMNQLKLERIPFIPICLGQSEITQNKILRINSINLGVEYYQLKMICDNCAQWQQRYEKTQAELTFEIKKLTEDMAEQKITLEMLHLKEIKKLSDKLQHEKEERQVQNRKWMEKYDSMTLFYKQKRKEKEKQCVDRIKEITLALSRAKERQYKDKETKMKKEIEQITTANEEYKKKIINAKEEQKKLVAKLHEEEKSKLKQQWKLQKQELKKQQERLTLSLSQHEQQELKLKTHNLELAYELNKTSEEVDRLNTETAHLQSCNQLCCDQLKAKENSILALQKEHNDKLKKTENESMIERYNLANSMNKTMEHLLQTQLEKFKKYEDKLTEMEKKREEELRLQRKNIEEATVTAEKQKNSPLRLTQQINLLKDRLQNREEDFQKALKQIQTYQLQLENKQEVFTKFMNPHLTISSNNILASQKKKDYSIKKSCRVLATRSSLKQSKQGPEKFSLTSSGGDFLNHLTSLENLDRFKDRRSKML